jgi:hypothetical protein
MCYSHPTSPNIQHFRNLAKRNDRISSLTLFELLSSTHSPSLKPRLLSRMIPCRMLLIFGTAIKMQRLQGTVTSIVGTSPLSPRWIGCSSVSLLSTLTSLHGTSRRSSAWMICSLLRLCSTRTYLHGMCRVSPACKVCSSMRMPSTRTSLYGTSRMSSVWDICSIWREISTKIFALGAVNCLRWLLILTQCLEAAEAVLPKTIPPLTARLLGPFVTRALLAADLRVDRPFPRRANRRVDPRVDRPVHRPVDPRVDRPVP